jgi:hypothetical protein
MRRGHIDQGVAQGDNFQTRHVRHFGISILGTLKGMLPCDKNLEIKTCKPPSVSMRFKYRSTNRILSEDLGSGMTVRCEEEMSALSWGVNVH